MNKTFLYIPVLLLLAGAAYLLVFNKSANTLNKAETAFSIEDTSTISRIEIRDNEGRTIILRRINEGYWSVGNAAFSFRARPDAVETMLNTLKRMRVAQPVNKAALPHVAELLENPVRTVKVFTDPGGETPAKTYRIAGDAPENKGTIMQLNDARQPYVVEVLGMQGHLLPRFVTIYETWRDRALFRYKPASIASVKVEYPGQPQASFLLDASNASKLTVTPLSGRDLGRPPVSQAINNYLNGFELVNVEAFQNDYPRIDSVKNSMPFCIITVTDRKGNGQTAVVHHMPVNKRSKLQTDRDGNAVPYDVDRLFAFVNKGHDFAIIQRYHCGWLFKGYDDFFKLPDIKGADYGK